MRSGAHGTAPPARQVEIPLTDREHYVTGVYALNVIGPDGKPGDWHDVFHWQEGHERPRAVTLAGGAEIRTTPFYGDLGVYEGREHLERQGLVVPPGVGEVYVADHMRAVLDLVYRSLTRWGRVRNLVGATTDWFETYEDGVTVLEYAARMTGHFPAPAQTQLRRWLDGEHAGLREVYG